MPQEIERKFLVAVERVPDEALRDGARFTQGYLSTRPVVRVRVAESPGREPEAWLTIKGPGGVARAEYEYPIPAAHAAEMVPLCVAVLHKTRYHVRVGAHTWDLDRYHGSLDGFWLAEVELRDVDEPFERPPWITDEVSHDPRYTNVALALAHADALRKGVRGDA
ncbi:MAG: CYTH domain-containing protein [Polyangiales bacterium]